MKGENSEKEIWWVGPKRIGEVGIGELGPLYIDNGDGACGHIQFQLPMQSSLPTPHRPLFFPLQIKNKNSCSIMRLELNPY